MFRIISTATLVLLLGGCAAFNNLHNEVSTYGPWPAERKPDTYVFERLPSQQAHPEHEQMLETAARGALEAAGFHAVSDPQNADYLMQVGAKVVSSDPWIYNDPLFWRGGWAYGRWGRGAYPFGGPFGGFPGVYGSGYGWGYGYGFDDRSYQREVALIIRDRKTGQLLYEARANNTGPSAAIDYLLPAMFTAALKDFPAAGPNPRQVTVPIAAK
jgi:hypothetical protein